MTRLDVTLCVFLVLFVPGFCLWLLAVAHDAIERRVERRRA